jgi:MFS family permease
MLAAAVFINYIDRGALPTAARLIQGDLKLDDLQMGKLLSAFFWTYSLAQIPVGWLAERIGAHRVLAGGLVMWASATVLTGFAHTFAMLMVLRLLLGLGESAGFPCMSKLLAVAVPPKGLGTANGIIGFAYLFGPAVGTYVGGYLMAQYGWRAAFYVFGALSLCWLLPWSRVTRRAEALRLRTPAAITRVPGSPTFWNILGHPALWGTGLGLFSSNYLLFFMLSWLPSYLERVHGSSTLEMAQLAGAGYLVNALSALLGGWLIDRWIARGTSANVAYKSVMALAHGGFVLCMLGMASGRPALAIAAMFGYQVLCGASSPGVYAMSQILAGPRASGRWVGIQNTLGSLAGIVAPWLTGAIVNRTGHFTTAFIVAAVMSAVGLIGWLVMVPRLQELRWE